MNDASRPELTLLSRNLVPIIVLLSLALIVVVVGAWIKGDENASLNPMAKAAEKTAELKGLRFDLDGTIAMEGLATPVAITGTGAADCRTQRTEMEMHSTVPGRGAVEISQVSTPSTLYYRTSPQPPLPGGKTWLAFDLDGEDSAGSETTDAKGMLEMLRDTSSDVETLGEIRVRGRPTTAYRATIDSEHVDEYTSDSNVSALVVTAWVDAKGIVRRMRETGETSFGDTDLAGTIDIQVELFDLNRPQEVALPSAAEVFEASPAIKESLGIDA